MHIFRALPHIMRIRGHTIGFVVMAMDCNIPDASQKGSEKHVRWESMDGARGLCFAKKVAVDAQAVR